MEGSSDSELVGLCRAGDGGAWNELVERYSRYVYAIAVQGFRLPQADAEDVFQDVFLRVYDRLHTLRNADALRPWIAQLTRRCCLDRLSSAKGEIPDEDAPEAADEVLGDLDQAMDVRAALGHLDATCREMLDRFFARDETYRVIADALGVPMGTVASRISRCLDKLRSQLEGRNLVPYGSSG